MAETSNVTIRVDSDIKKQVERLFEQMGLNTTTAINMFFRQIIRQQKIPFEISADPFYSSSNQELLVVSKLNLEAGKSLIIKSMEEL